MTVMQIITPNADFAELASDERIARTLAALGPRGITAEVVETGAAARARVLELLPLGAEVFTSLSETLAETGLAAEINESGRYNAIRPKLVRSQPPLMICPPGLPVAIEEFQEATILMGQHVVRIEGKNALEISECLGRRRSRRRRCGRAPSGCCPG